MASAALEVSRVKRNLKEEEVEAERHNMAVGLLESELASRQLDLTRLRLAQAEADLAKSEEDVVKKRKSLSTAFLQDDPTSSGPSYCSGLEESSEPERRVKQRKGKGKACK